MSRVANAPISVPSGVDINLDGQNVKVKGSKGQMEYAVHPSVSVERDGDVLKVAALPGLSNAVALAGTMRSLLSNMVTGVTTGFEKRLELVGVGYRAQMQGKTLNLALGFSHPVHFEPPEGVSIETPSQTQVVVSGIDKQKVGQAAANIRAYRPPEPYKGKGIKYSDEIIVRKEAKKK
jgi:large subunit ribosomal protein L6